MLGKQVDKPESVPDGAMVKTIPAAQYAVYDAPLGTSLVNVWTHFFYTVIPEQGYCPDESHGFYFEYYSTTTNGSCELWVPVVRI